MARITAYSRSKRVFIGADSKGRMAGTDKVLARLASLPDGIVSGIAPVIDKAADDLVESIKAIVPVSDLDDGHVGRLRDSVHKEDDANPLAKRVVEDAKDGKGHGYAPQVEFGHKTRGGEGRVPAKPHFYPATRVARKKLSAQITRGMGKVIRAVAAGSAES